MSLVLFISSFAQAYEGFGASTPGGTPISGRTARTIHVTNLDDRGPGSFYQAMLDAAEDADDYSTTISFENVSPIGDGVIHGFRWKSSDGSNGSMNVNHLTIDGSTAPSPGITLSNVGTDSYWGDCMAFENGCHDIIVKHIRVRGAVGDGFACTGNNVYNIVFDHCSASGCGDGDFDITAGAHDITVQWCIFGPVSTASTGGAMLIAFSPTKNISIHHNLFNSRAPGTHGERNPLVHNDGVSTNDLMADIRNNVIWNWGQDDINPCCHFGYGTGLNNSGTANIINNFYQTDGSEAPAATSFNYPVGGAKGYVSGNISGNTEAGINPNTPYNGLTIHATWSAAFVTTQDACTAAVLVKAQAGCQPLDATDEALVNAVSLSNCPSCQNHPPTANAGNDVTLTLPVNSTTLSGSGSDNDGGIARYQWSLVSGPGNYTFGNANEAATTLSNLVLGTYIFRLTVTDNAGAIATDNIIIIVKSFTHKTLYNIFQPTDPPASHPITLGNDDDRRVEIGVKFKVPQAQETGFIKGVRFYKQAGNTGIHKGHLWSSTGTMLAEATFTGESPSGWQQASFTVPIAVTAGATYIASYYSSDGFYSYTNNYFPSTGGIVNGPLLALPDGQGEHNGVYTYIDAPAESGFPTESSNSSNYWVDVVYQILDTKAPTAPSICYVGRTSTSITLTISGTTDNFDIADYYVYLNNSTTVFASWHYNPDPGYRYTINNLNPGVSYSIKVIALDGAGNQSPASIINKSTLPTKILFDEGFEDNCPFANFIRYPNENPGSITQSNAHAKTGAYSFKSLVIQTDPSVSGTWDATISPMNVIDEGDRWYGLSMYFEGPASGGFWTGNGGEGNLLQWHDNTSCGPAVLSLLGTNGEWDIVTDPDANGTGDHHNIPAGGSQPLKIESNKWYDIVVHINWNTGEIKFWINGIVHTDLTGQNALGQFPGQYLKIGMKRWPIAGGATLTNDWTVFYDNIKIGNGNASYCDVTTVAAPTVTVQNNCGNSVLTASNYTGSLLWSNNATTASITVNVAGIYTVTQTNANGCTSSNGTGGAEPKIIPQPPVITFPENTSLCQGQSVTLRSSARSPNLWSTGATAQSIVVTTPGTYTVTYTNPAGCSATSAPVVLTMYPIPPAPTISVSSYCSYSVLTAGNYTGSLLWNTGATTPSITSMSNITFLLKQIVNGCASAQTTSASHILRPEPPTVTVVNSCGNSVLTASSYYGGSFLWSNGATTSSITVTTAGTYTVTVTSSGCTSYPASGTAAPKVIPLPPTVTVENNDCNSVLTASDYTGSLLWSTGATTASITVTTPGTYTVTQTTANGCTSPVASGDAEPSSPLDPVTVTLDINCSESILTAVDYVGDLLWSNGETTPSITVTDAGNYSVTQTVDECTSTPTIVRTAPDGKPVLSSPLTDETITDRVYNYTPASLISGLAYSWHRVGVSGINGGEEAFGTDGISQVLVNQTGSPIDVIYEYTLATNKCSNIENLVVTVYPDKYEAKSVPIHRSLPVQTSPDSLAIQALQVKVIPNPSVAYFNLLINSSNKNPVIVRVLDINGKVIERHEKISPNTTLRLGPSWTSGTYFAEVVQGDQRKVVKMIKVN